MALTKGRRGLPGGSSLAQLLAKHRGKRNSAKLPSFSIARILKWADAHHRRTGMWPTLTSGPVLEAPGETWTAIDEALRRGVRGMRGGSSLPRLLRRHRNVAFNQARRPPLTIAMILAWADAHHDRTGAWPQVRTGPIFESPLDTWGSVEKALRDGRRGLQGGSTLKRLLDRHRRNGRAK